MLTDDFDLKTAALTDEERARLLLCMVRYENGGTEMELPGNERILWPMFKWEIDRAKEAAIMEEKARIAASERNRRAAEKRWGKDHASVDDTENATQCACTETQCGEMQAHAGACGRIAGAQAEDKEKGAQKETEDGERDNIISTPPKPPAKKAEEDFAVFWMAYPRKEKKKDALSAWMKLNPAPELQRKMILAVQARRASPEWQRENGRYIPHAAAWINGRRWEDQPTEIQSGPGKRVGAQMYAQRDYTEEELDMGFKDELIAAARAYRNKEAATG